MEITELKAIAQQVRRDIIRQVYSASSGHPGGSLGAADILTALYFDIMKIYPPHFDMHGEGEDIFYLSNGHLSPLWYSVLSRRGYFPVEELKTFRKLNSRLQGHPATVDNLPGIRVASGSLGQGLSVAIGHAIGKKLKGDNCLVFVMLGDGELQSGQIWEAAMYAGSKKVDNLVAIVDYNGQQIDGTVESVMSLGNLRLKWESFGWDVLEANGNDMVEVVNTFRIAKLKTKNTQPIIILMKTEMGYGVSFMTGTNKWHGIAPTDIEKDMALLQIEETLGDY